MNSLSLLALQLEINFRKNNNYTASVMVIRVHPLTVFTVLSFVGLFLITLHALIVKEWQFFPTCLYLLTGDTTVGLTAQTSDKAFQSSHIISLSVDGVEVDTLSSYSAPAHNLFVAVMVSCVLSVMIHTGLLLKKLFFGNLRLLEREHVMERALMAASDCFLAMSIFKDALDSGFIIRFCALMILKAFHWICRDRVEYVQNSQNFLF